MGLFKRNFTEDEQRQMNEAFGRISSCYQQHIDRPEFAYNFFHASIQEQQLRVIRDLNRMTEAGCGIYRCATRLHPISWFGYGLCVPFLPGRDILISEKTFSKGMDMLMEIVAHEYSHSRLHTVDGPMGRGVDSDDFEECITDAWKWSSLVRYPTYDSCRKPVPDGRLFTFNVRYS